MNLTERTQVELVRNSALFDASWYVAQYPDVGYVDLDPVIHFVRYGGYMGRNPGPNFDTAKYLAANPQLNGSDINPLAHFLTTQSDPPPTPTVASPQGLPEKTQRSEGNKQKLAAPTIALVAHQVTQRKFGGERSFIDMAAGIAAAGFNLLVVVPSRSNSAYIDELQQHAIEVVSFPYKWWANGNPIDKDTIDDFSRLFAFFEVAAVHVNTIMVREAILAAKRLSIPGVVHVRELIEYDEALYTHIGETPEHIVSWITENASHIVANSAATAAAFNKTGNTTLIPNTIDFDSLAGVGNKQGDTVTIGMLSSNLPKKGIYDFVAIANRVAKQRSDCKFLMFGPINDHVEGFQQDQKAGKTTDMVQFPGYVEHPAEAIAQCDIIVNLSHFQESFGRTVLEAMAAGKPVIAYDWGALNELVQDGTTGYLVDFKNIEAAAERILHIIDQPQLRHEMGTKAQGVAEQEYGFPRYCQRFAEFYGPLLNFSPRIEVDVSVVIPNYNYENFLPERINSILQQTVKPKEILFLDDCSPDNSIKVAEDLLAAGDVPYRIIANTTNQGVYAQWQRGVREASGTFLWIAEADDSAAPEFLETCLPSFNYPRVGISFSQSKVIDENGETVRERNFHHTDDVSKTRWLTDYHALGHREVVDSLLYRNTIPNVSAVVFRRQAILNEIPKLSHYAYAGDWYLYTQILRHNDVCFHAEPLNRFRRHSASVTRSKGQSEQYLEELIQIHSALTAEFPVTHQVLARMQTFLNRDYKIEGVAKNTESGGYRQIAEEVEARAKGRRRIAFLTTNNGSHNGGSEVLWRESAWQLRDAGHDVVCVIKDWQPQPDYFKEYFAHGIDFILKDGEELKRVADFSPDLLVVSLGDQDEGINYFPSLVEMGIPYVIVNQLTKQAEYWPIREQKTEAVRAGYLGAKRVYFTCQNNHRVMEKRLSAPIPNHAIHFNPYHIDRNISIPWPQTETFNIAIPARLLNIHKGQELAFEVLSRPAWRERPVRLRLYGDGPDEPRYRQIVQEYGLENVDFVPRVADMLDIWRDNHAIMLPSYMEGLPIVLVAAMLCARVPILTDIGGHAEVVSDNISGFIAKLPGADALDDAMTRAYQRTAEWESIGQAARASILNFLPEDPTADFCSKLLQHVDELTGYK